MIVFNNETYYSAKEVRDILQLSNSSNVIGNPRRKDKLKNEYIVLKKRVYIKKSFIDSLINSRRLSVTLKEASKLIDRSKWTTLDIIHYGKLKAYKDIWSNEIRVYIEDIDNYLSYRNWYTAKDLAKIFRITEGNILKKIRFNYSDISKFKKYFGKNIYIEKEFLDIHKVMLIILIRLDYQNF